jgi:hypothetical protein
MYIYVHNICGGNPSSSGEDSLGGTSVKKVETLEAKRTKGPRAIDLKRDTCQQIMSSGQVVVRVQLRTKIAEA